VNAVLSLKGDRQGTGRGQAGGKTSYGSSKVINLSHDILHVYVTVPSTYTYIHEQ